MSKKKWYEEIGKWCDLEREKASGAFAKALDSTWPCSLVAPCITAFYENILLF